MEDGAPLVTADHGEAAVIIGGWRGPGWRVVEAAPGLGHQVRGMVRSAIAGHGCPVDVDTAESCVGEMFANAVMHGPGGRVLAGYCLWRAGARLVVCDGGGPAVPVLRQAGNQAESWRGLQVIDALAARWGHFRLPGAQVVWCDLGEPLRVPASDAWAWLPPVLSECRLSASGRPAVAVPPDTLAAVGAR
jgi:hypothetical protein